MAEKTYDKTWRDFLDDPYVLRFPKADREIYAVRRALSDRLRAMTEDEKAAFWDEEVRENERMHREMQGMTREERLAYLERELGDDV
jgi:hypothetical protein